MNKYDDLEFCLNLINDYLDSSDKSKYRIEPIIVSELKIENILKDKSFDPKDILKDIKLESNYNKKKIYHGKNYELHIIEYTGNPTQINDEEHISLIYNYILGELVTINNIDCILLNIMNFIISNKSAKLKDFDADSNLLVSVFNKKSMTLKEFIKSNKLDIMDFKNIFFQVLLALYKMNIKMKNFRHNKLDLESVRIIKNEKSKNIKINFGDIDFEINNKYIVNITNFENATSNIITKYFGVNNLKENPYYDIHYFFSSIMNEFVESLDPKIINFIESIIPEQYRKFELKEYKLDEKIFENNESKFILPEDIIEKNGFFDEIRINKVSDTDMSVSPINISENSLSRYNKLDRKIKYDIEINSLTETSNENSRMFAKNIKYKYKKTYSNYNNIKDSMIKGTRNLYVPNRNNLKEGSMTASDVFRTIEEKDVRKEKKDRKDRQDRRRRDEEDEMREKLEEVSGESTLESEEKNMSRSSAKKSKKSKSSKKVRRFSDSSLTSLSSIEETDKQSPTATQVNKTLAPMMAELGMNQSGKSAQPVQSAPAVPATNRFADLFGHSISDTQPPTGAPHHANPEPVPISGNMGMSVMSEGTMTPQGMPMMMPQQGMPMMMPQGMPQQGMPMMMPQGMPQQGMPMMMPQGMPQMGQQTVTLNEGGMGAQLPQIPAEVMSQMGQIGGERKVLKLKKDFFF